jgi:hypothetical protein
MGLCIDMISQKEYWGAIWRFHFNSLCGASQALVLAGVRPDVQYEECNQDRQCPGWTQYLGSEDPAFGVICRGTGPGCTS